MWTVFVTLLIDQHVLSEGLFTFLANEWHFCSLGQRVDLGFSVTFGTVVPLFAAGGTNGNLCIYDMLAGHYDMNYTRRRKDAYPTTSLVLVERQMICPCGVDTSRCHNFVTQTQLWRESYWLLQDSMVSEVDGGFIRSVSSIDRGRSSCSNVKALGGVRRDGKAAFVQWRGRAGSGVHNNM